MKPPSTVLRRLALVGVSSAALLCAGLTAPAAADSSGGSSRSEVSSRSGSSGGSSGSSSRSGVSSRGSSSSSRSGGAVRSRGSSGSSVSGSSRSSGGAVVTRPSHGRLPSRWSGGYGHHGHRSHYDFRFGFFGYYPYWYWGSPYYGYGPGYYGYGYYPPVTYASTPGYGMGALDLNVQPKQTEVYVNGQYVGLVKQYDGFPGYLWLESGLYEVAFYRPGFETITREFEIFTGMVLDVALEMVPGEAVLPSRPEQRPVAQAPRQPLPNRSPEQPPASYERPQVREEATTSRVELEVEPADASVYLDGRFVGIARDLADGLSVGAGEHVVEVVLPGYEQETVRFEARPGLDASVEVRLEPSAGSAAGR